MDITSVMDQYRAVGGNFFTVLMQGEKFWNDFNNSIKNEHRFFPYDVEVRKAIEVAIDEITYFVKADDKPYYRARVIKHGELANDIIKDYFKKSIHDDAKAEILDKFAATEIESEFIIPAMMTSSFGSDLRLPDCLSPALKELWNKRYQYASFANLSEESLIGLIQDLMFHKDASPEINDISTKIDNGDFWGFNDTKSGVAPIGKVVMVE